MKIQSLILSLLTMQAAICLTASCSNAAQDDSLDIPDIIDGVVFRAPAYIMPEDGGNHDMASRAAYYNGSAGKVSFNWTVGDVAGIFPMVDEAQQIKYDCKNVSESTDANGTFSKGIFKPQDVDFDWEEGKEYRSYYPYNSAAPDITAVALDYRDQQQKGKPDITASKTGKQTLYDETERTASAHLSAKTFLVSERSKPIENSNNMGFDLKHVGGIVRFYLALPNDIDANITEIRLVATKPVFHETASLNMITGESSPTGVATNNLTLTLNNVHLKYDSSTDTYGHYLAAYMMAYPVQLTSNDVLGNTGKLYIYVKGQSSSADVYFRTNAVTKKDIASGTLTQFSIKSNNYDDPIDMQPITVQEWLEGLTFDDTDGKGTGDW